MRTAVKGIVLGVPTLAVFLGVLFYDAGQRATRLQDLAHSELDLCESMAAQAGGATESCTAAFRGALDASSSLAWKAALPLALAAALIFLVLALGVMYLVQRRRKADSATA